jgi:hypothetical protein
MSDSGRTGWAPGPKSFRDPEPWEVKVLVLIAEHVAIPMDLLARLLKITPERAASLMDEFAGYRWVEVQQLLAADEPWVWLRQSGLEHSGTGFHWLRPSIWSLPHRRAICVIRLELEATYPDGVWICERELVRRRGFVHHVPDGAFEIHNSEGRLERWAIEAELSTKLMQDYREIAVDRTERYDRVMYYCSPVVARLLQRVPGFSEHPQITVHEFFKDSRKVKNFQWVWSPTSGPGETGLYRQPQPWEVEILRLVSEQGAMSIDHLARFLECNLDSAQRIADYLDEAGFLNQGRGPLADPNWVWVTKSGGRLAGTGLRHYEPTTTSTMFLSLANEARLHVAERDWNVHWWSMRLLRRGAERLDVPTAIVEADDEQNAIEIESKRRSRAELIEKYDRRCREFHAVALFCSARRVPTFEQLKRERGWKNLHVQSFKPLNRKQRRRGRKKRPTRYVEIGLEELPQEALQVVQEAEHLLSPPRVRSVSLARGAGFARWRVTTDSREWRVAQTPFGWFVRPCDELDEPLEDPEPRGTPDPGPLSEEEMVHLPRAMRKISIGELPQEALHAIRAAAELQEPPAVTGVKRRQGPGFPRWRVETDAGAWRVTCSPVHGWLAKPAEGTEEPSSSLRRRRWPRDPPGVMVDVEPWEVPPGVVQTIEKTAGLSWPPKVIKASRRLGQGSGRWRVETDHDTWRVTNSSHGWTATLSY